MAKRTQGKLHFRF